MRKAALSPKPFIPNSKILRKRYVIKDSQNSNLKISHINTRNDQVVDYRFKHIEH